MVKLQDLPDLFWQDALTLLCGELIGAGLSRQVYTCPMNDDVVIKVETGLRHQNVLEWETWHAATNDPKISRWLAPCHYISDCGRWLVMSRTRPLGQDQLPKQMPAFLTDFKRANYGIYKGRVVCHDYGVNLAIDRGLSTRLRKVHWWS